MDSNWRKIVSQAQQSWRAIGVHQSPLVADFDLAPRSLTEFAKQLAWFIASIAISLAAGIAVLIVLLIVIIVPVVVVMIASGHDPQEIQSLADLVQRTNFKPGYWMALGLIWTLAITNGAIMLTTVWIASLLNRKKLRLSFTTARRWRWSQLFGAMILYGLMLGVLELFDVLILGQKASLPLLSMSPTPLMGLVFVVLAALGLIVAAGAEELVFRGWLLRHSAALMRWTWLYILIDGTLFSLVHGDFDPNAFIARTVMGWGLCYMALRMGGIEFSTGAHAANNLLIVLFIEPLTLVTPPPQPFDIGSLVDTATMLVLMIAATEIAIRVPFIARLVGPPSTGAELPAAQVFN